MGDGMELSNYPCESLNFSGLGVTGATPEAAGEALAEALAAWVAGHRGQHLLQVTPVPATTGDQVGIAALIIHTAASDLEGELAQQVAAAVEDAMEMATADETDGTRRPGNGQARRRPIV
jgi:hypothetical protein